MVKQLLLLLLFFVVLTGCNKTESITAPTETAIPDNNITTPHQPSVKPLVLPTHTKSPKSAPSTTLIPTHPPTLVRPTNTLTPAIKEASPPSTTSQPDTPAEPQVFSFEVIPMEVDPGDTVTITWEARGDHAIICPSTNLYVLFTSDDCREVSVSGTMSFPIPLETTSLHSPIRFTLDVKSDSATSINDVVSVELKCHTDWFFSDIWHEPGCPQEAVRSHAAAQNFEQGTMIWLEQFGHYVILDQALMVAGEIRKQDHHIYDPLEIIQDTSDDFEPPEGFFAPESGFGLVWRGDVHNSPGFRDSLGWAVTPEFGYETIYQCTDGYLSGGIVWQDCYLKLPDGEVVFFHPLGGWYFLSEK